MKQITLYVNGSCLGNQLASGYGGWCTVLKYKDAEKVFCGRENDTTKHKMELLSVITGFENIKEPCEVIVITNSKYISNGITKWLDNWIKKDFKGIKNEDLWRKFHIASLDHKISVDPVDKNDEKHISERCDRLALVEAKKLRVEITTVGG